tara:strand:+ start:332 stop:514 length:183 start_codon:yes stop_codon:yes gene_type:complete
VFIEYKRTNLQSYTTETGNVKEWSSLENNTCSMHTQFARQTKEKQKQKNLKESTQVKAAQ